MRYSRYLALLLNFYSVSVVAGHVCTIQLAHNEDLYKTIAEKTVTTKNGVLSSVIVGTILVEQQKETKKGIIKESTHLDLHGVVDGYDNQQESTFVFVRKDYKKGKRVGWESVSEKFTVRGTDKGRLWFDNYKAEISCIATNENE